MKTMKHQIFSTALVEEAARKMKVANLQEATIGEVLLVASHLEKETGIPFIRMDQGSPGLPANRIGIEAEKAALDRGVGATYPAAAGVQELKEAASRFVKAFINTDISPRSCIPTTGSVASSFASFIACTQRNPQKDTVLFIDPGFPIQKSQLRILGVKWEQFDIYHFRGNNLRDKLESFLEKGHIAAIIYSNPNNPAWICLEESELKIIGELATKHDVIVLEDLAYFCMDFRKDMGKPFEPPYPPTVARYTDNYIIMLSASKIFSYAGQRIALACISDKLFDRQFPALAERYADSGIFGPTFIASILYMITSGCTASTQYGYAEMLNRSVDGTIDFVADTRVYAERASQMKKSSPITASISFTIGTLHNRSETDFFHHRLRRHDKRRTHARTPLLRSKQHFAIDHRQRPTRRARLHIAHARRALSRITRKNGKIPQRPPHFINTNPKNK